MERARSLADSLSAVQTLTLLVSVSLLVMLPLMVSELVLVVFWQFPLALLVSMVACPWLLEASPWRNLRGTLASCSILGLAWFLPPRNLSGMLSPFSCSLSSCWATPRNLGSIQDCKADFSKKLRNYQKGYKYFERDFYNNNKVWYLYFWIVQSICTLCRYTILINQMSKS